MALHGIVFFKRFLLGCLFAFAYFGKKILWEVRVQMSFNRGEGIDIEMLGFSKRVASKAWEVYGKVKEVNGIRGRFPSVIIASCVYIAGVICGEYKSQEVVGKKFGRSACAIRHCFHKIMEAGIPEIAEWNKK